MLLFTGVEWRIDRRHAELYSVTVHVLGRYVVPIEVTYTQARANLAALCNQAAADREAVIVHRRGAEDVALISAAELRSLLETAHLLRSPRNAQRLLKALARTQAQAAEPSSVDEVRRELGPGERP